MTMGDVGEKGAKTKIRGKKGRKAPDSERKSGESVLGGRRRTRTIKQRE